MDNPITNATSNTYDKIAILMQRCHKVKTAHEYCIYKSLDDNNKTYVRLASA